MMTDPSPAAWPQANLLGGETSPYLLQHAANPVHWRPWGAAALEEARAMGKPILLSIGYAACHWCHVMAHESFENPAIAAVMNELFVNIKVDREERPDIDQIYMAALHALGQQGGWPLTMFLTPDGEPVWGGTYFPPQSRYGRPGFPDVLRSVAAIFRDEPDKIEANRAALMRHLAAPAKRGTAGLSRADLDEAALRLADVIDPVQGGPRGAPKFPNAAFLELLWRGALRLGPARGEPLRRGVLTTLREICRGGIRDHVGGGFARYAVDERWLVPHFEKMLYDNAQLLDLLALAWRDTGEALFRDAAVELVEWLRREMMAGDGRAFAASLDADSEGHEGRFYVWTPAEVEAALPLADAAWVRAAFDITDGGNWEGVSIPNRLGCPPLTPEERQRWDGLRPALLAHRAERVPPGRDDKVLADWNALMIAALVHAARAFERPDWLALAQGAYDFVSESMQRDGRLGHSWREGRLLFPGLASDHAAMMLAALALHEAAPEGRYLADAQRWAEAMERLYTDPDTGGYFHTAEDAKALILRPRSALDEAVPNANGMMAQALIRLAVISGEDRWRERADTLLVGLSPQIGANIFGHASLLNALDLRLTGAEIVIVGKGGDADALAETALDLPFLIRIGLRVPDAEALSATHPARAKALAIEGAAAFVCMGERCSLPVTDVKALRETVAAMRG